MNTDQKILDNLIGKGLITSEVASELKSSSFNSGRPVIEILESKNLVNEDELIKVRSEVLNVPLVILKARGISPEILEFIPESVAKKYKIMPFDYSRKDGKLFVAMTDPMNLYLLQFLEKKSGKVIVPSLGKESDILEKISEEYSAGLSGEVTEALKETSASEVKTVEAENIGKIIKEAPIAKIVSTILEFAVKSRASDIHLEPQDVRTRVRYRIDGILQEKLALPKTVHEAVISRIKILSGMKIDERRVPQDGRFNFNLGVEEIDLRVSSLPTAHGEKIVMRLLKKTGGIPDLPELGLRGISLKNIELSLLKPHGIILITGPTGSGKTTTLYSILQRLNTQAVNIVTLEDPIEYEIVGLNQVQINPQAGLTFASGLRSFLRQDPNIILVGEIRDSDTTALAIQAALTGHLVFSTLHTNNAATAIPRLLDLGAEPFLIVSVLTSVGAQRITRKICNSCKVSYSPPREIAENIKKELGPLFIKDKEIILYKGEGCKECANSGYLGRVGIFENILISNAISKMILERAPAEQIEKQSRLEGTTSILQDGYLKTLEGTTTLEEVLRVAKE